jgi:hypothetical protein
LLGLPGIAGRGCLRQLFDEGPQTRPTAAIRQERPSASGLTGDVDGELPPAQNTAFWVMFVIMAYKPRAAHNGGSRATVATTGCHHA